jgi:hypothetical protein
MLCAAFVGGCTPATSPMRPLPLPTETATAAPTASPSAVVLSPSTLSFAAIGSAYAQTVTASQSNYGGAFSVSGTTCTGYATITATSGTQFTITPTASRTSGTPCMVTIAGGSGQSAALTINITTTTVGGS